MKVINPLKGQMPPMEDEFTPIGFYGLIRDIRVCVNMLDREWCDREARAWLIWQLESAVRALGYMAAGREILRAFDEAGDVYYAYKEEEQ
jgi:hypothetical protein